MTATRARLAAAAIAAAVVLAGVTVAVVSPDPHRRPPRIEVGNAPEFSGYRPGDPLPAPPPPPAEGDPPSTVPGPYGPIYPDGYTERTTVPTAGRPTGPSAPTAEEPGVVVAEPTPSPEPSPEPTTPTTAPVQPTPIWQP